MTDSDTTAAVREAYIFLRDSQRAYKVARQLLSDAQTRCDSAHERLFQALAEWDAAQGGKT